MSHFLALFENLVTMYVTNPFFIPMYLLKMLHTTVVNPFMLSPTGYHHFYRANILELLFCLKSSSSWNPFSSSPSPHFLGWLESFLPCHVLLPPFHLAPCYWIGFNFICTQHIVKMLSDNSDKMIHSKATHPLGYVGSNLTHIVKQLPCCLSTCFGKVEWLRKCKNSIKGRRTKGHRSFERKLHV